MKKNIYVVGAVVVDGEKILCVQRGEGKALAHKWEFPGGKIEDGESPQEALRREIDEEMKCEVEVGEQIEHTVYEYDFGIVHLTTFYCTVKSGHLTLTEHIAKKWLLPHELLSLDWAPADIPAVEKLMTMKGK